MPRRPRAEEAGAIHHVYARGNRSQPVFMDAADRRRYLRVLAAVVEKYRWRCLAYCLMGNHVHLLVETLEPNLGDGMRMLHGDYALGFNKRHSIPGHVFQGRFGSVRIKDDAHLITALRYVERNPVEAALVVAPEEWPWSSAKALRGGTCPSWLALWRLRELIDGDAKRIVEGSDPSEG